MEFELGNLRDLSILIKGLFRISHLVLRNPLTFHEWTDLPSHLKMERERQRRDISTRLSAMIPFLLLLAFFSHDLIFSKVTLPKCLKWNYALSDCMPNSVMMNILIITQRLVENNARARLPGWIKPSVWHSNLIASVRRTRIHFNVLPPFV